MERNKVLQEKDTEFLHDYAKEVRRIWNEITDISKALAPIWILMFFIALCVVGGFLLISGIWWKFYVGISAIVFGWITVAFGWGYAREISRSILDRHP